MSLHFLLCLLSLPFPPPCLDYTPSLHDTFSSTSPSFTHFVANRLPLSLPPSLRCVRVRRLRQGNLRHRLYSCWAHRQRLHHHYRWRRWFYLYLSVNLTHPPSLSISLSSLPISLSLLCPPLFISSYHTLTSFSRRLIRYHWSNSHPS